MKRPAIIGLFAWGLLLAIGGTAQAAGDPAAETEECYVHWLSWN